MSSRWGLVEVTQGWVLLDLHVAPLLLQLLGVGPVVQVILGNKVLVLSA